MKVFIAGMPRSGSTFSFNVTRLLLEKRGTVRTEAVAADVGATFNRIDDTADALIIKAHQVDDLGLEMVRSRELLCIITVRDPEEAMASWMQTFEFSFTQSLKVFEEWYRMFNMIKPWSLVLDYLEIETHPSYSIRKIIRHLGVQSNFLEVWRISRELEKRLLAQKIKSMARDGQGVVDAGFSFYNRTTFLHRNHISLGSRESAHKYFSAEERERIRAVFQ